MEKQITAREAQIRASSLLEQDQHYPKIAEWLLLHLLQCTRSQYLQRLDEPLSEIQAEQYFEWIQRVLKGEPYQYIIGVQEFFGREFQVSPAVLIPRPETEILVEQVLEACQSVWPKHKRIAALDIGTGSGAIAITLALESPQLELLAVDISNEALEVARHNASAHGASVRFVQSDLLDAFQADAPKIDLIVSNPPYIALEEKSLLERTVVDFEPHLALFAEEDGTYFYRRIIEQSPLVLQSPGVLAFEVGQGQAEQVAALVRHTYPHARCQVKKDLAGVERIVLAFL